MVYKDGIVTFYEAYHCHMQSYANQKHAILQYTNVQEVPLMTYHYNPLYIDDCMFTEQVNSLDQLADFPLVMGMK